ncbi:MAG: ABC transporter permease [Clostridiales bacterium]
MMKIFMRMFRSNMLFALGFIICIAWIFVAIFAYQIIPYDPISQDMSIRLLGPSAAHWFGTDEFGRDVLSRVLVGSRLSLMAGLITVLLAGTVGTLFGAIAGYIGGLADDIMMRFSEMVLSFPAIILAMTITAALGPSLYNTLLALVIVSWPAYARVMRSVVISIKENEYIEAAKALGASRTRILLRDIIPNSIGSVLVMATLDIGNQILFFSALSFLGLGSPPPTPEWGAMVSDGMTNFNCWWISTFAGLGILTMAVGANFLGDGVRDFLDPKLRKEF